MPAPSRVRVTLLLPPGDAARAARVAAAAGLPLAATLRALALAGLRVVDDDPSRLLAPTPTPRKDVTS